MQNDNALPWLILEHIPFGLTDFFFGRVPWPQPPLPPIDAADVVMQLASFLDSLHRNDTIHADLSSNNVRLDPGEKRWVVKVIDLGELEAGKCVQNIGGTLGFTAPEALWHRLCNEKIDMFSLGMLAFGLFTKYNWREAKYDWEEAMPMRPASCQAYWMCERVLPMASEVDAKFRPLLGGLLALDAEKRWSAQKVIEFLYTVSGTASRLDRKRVGSPRLSNDAKRRRASEASTIRPARAMAGSDSSSTAGSFVTARESEWIPGRGSLTYVS